MWSPGFEFWVPGRALGKGRARARRVRNFVRMFTPAKTVAAENGVRVIARGAMAQAGFALTADAPLRVTLEIAKRPPASQGRRVARALVDARAWDTRKPDLDNAAKLVMDALNGVAWRDDCQVAELIVRKRVSAVEGASVCVEVWRSA